MMPPFSASQRGRTPTWLVAVAGLALAALLLVVVFRGSQPGTPTVSADHLDPSATTADPAPLMPPESIASFRAVLAPPESESAQSEAGEGASQKQALTREAALAWLDTASRQRTGLPAAEIPEVLAALAADRPDHLTPGYWQHLYNSALNALRAPSSDDRHHVAALLDLLLDHAAAHPDRVIRLYALQHIGILWLTDDLDQEQSLRTLTLVRALAAQPEGEVSGTALALLDRWSARLGEAPIELARALAADSARAIDVRVSALLAAGTAPDTISLARDLAADRTQPIILRKASLALLGQHGTAADLPLLEQTAAESSRLAQAALPASEALAHRLEHPHRPAPVPYQ